MTAVDYLTYVPKNYEPIWMTSERFDYCDKGIAPRTFLPEIVSSIISKFKHSK